MTSREDKFRVYNDVLVHSSTCQNAECTYGDGRCLKVRQSVDHFARCYSARRATTPEIEACEACGKIWGLMCFHAKYCATALADHCGVAQCDYLRNKIAQKQRNDALELLQARDRLFAEGEDLTFERTVVPVERRIAAAEHARLETMHMIEEYRRQRATMH